MAVNPKNVLKLLQMTFNQPQYNVESAISENERALCLQIESLLKDAMSVCLFVETHEELIFEDKEHEDLCSLSHPLAIDEDDSENVPYEETNGNSSSSEDKNITLEYK
ncbi:hypothetical protein ABEB36_009240 [Hypothenemus hampei]|uniref:Uncharacterized protein n=1 Tax=Hypothenemus hampei TaxID=57062 RepID=A0ABD1ESK0_HYPHA